MWPPNSNRQTQYARWGILLVSHGTRSRIGQAQFLHLAELVRPRLDAPLEPAYLELAEPTIAAAVGRLLDAGTTRLVVAPLLLFAAGHARQDVPAAVGRALAECGAPALPTVQVPAFGCHRLIVELAAARLVEALAAGGITTPESRRDVLLVAVGRGSRDEQATAEMHRLAAIVAERTGVGGVEVGFLAMAKPRAEEVLRRAGGGPRHVAVLPHLLFHGELLEELGRQVAARAAGGCRRRWLMADVLAADLLSGGVAAEHLPALVVEGIKQAQKCN
jgi:sirohydrochlorin cobaltochelatase